MRLAAQGLDKTTNILVTADHGFATISRQSANQRRGEDAVRQASCPAILPPGFIAIDMAKALRTETLFDPSGAAGANSDYQPLPEAAVARCWRMIRRILKVVIAFNGGSDLIYLPEPDKALAARVVNFLTTEDYTGAIFVRDDLGPIPGALPFSAIGLAGLCDLTPAPAIIVGFANHAGACGKPEICGIEIGDTELQQGQGMHGTFGRQDTHNFMAAIGPDFKAGFRDPAPVGNADLAITAAHLLDIDLPIKGRLTGRVWTEALTADGTPVPSKPLVMSSAPAENGFATILNWQEADGRPYYDAAGMMGRTLGLIPLPLVH